MAGAAHKYRGVGTGAGDGRSRRRKGFCFSLLAAQLQAVIGADLVVEQEAGPEVVASVSKRVSLSAVAVNICV